VRKWPLITAGVVVVAVAGITVADQIGHRERQAEQAQRAAEWTPPPNETSTPSPPPPVMERGDGVITLEDVGYNAEELGGAGGCWDDCGVAYYNHIFEFDLNAPLGTEVESASFRITNGNDSAYITWPHGLTSNCGPVQVVVDFETMPRGGTWRIEGLTHSPLQSVDPFCYRKQAEVSVDG
jgi:hypothetical protein